MIIDWRIAYLVRLLISCDGSIAYLLEGGECRLPIVRTKGGEKKEQAYRSTSGEASNVACENRVWQEDDNDNDDNNDDDTQSSVSIGGG